MLGPASSYSLLAIHMLWKDERQASREPPTHTMYLRSGEASTFTL